MRILKKLLITIGLILGAYLLLFLAFLIIMPEDCIGVSAYIDETGNCVYD